jgi:hypothetical protein
MDNGRFRSGLYNLERDVSKKQGERTSKREERRLQMERERRMKMLRIWGPIAAVVVALVALLLFRLFEPDVEGITRVTAAPANQHDNSFVYDPSPLPPTGGVHATSWLNCGIYDDEVPPENAVHSMEHGAVWVTYDPEQVTADEIATLKSAVRGKGDTILSQYSGQASSIVLTAWDLQLQVDSATDSRISQFINKYRSTRGPEAGAPCSGSVGTPNG